MRLGILPGTGREQFPGEPQGAPGTPRACLQLVGRERVPPVGAGVPPCSVTLGHVTVPQCVMDWGSGEGTGGQRRRSLLRPE